MLKLTSLIFSLFVASLLNAPLLAAAGAVLRLSASQAAGQGNIPTVKVWRGSGINISFIPTGEAIQKAWLDDPSHLTVDFDGALPGATSLHLRRINYINFPQLPSGNSTLLTVITQGTQGRQRYLFRLTYGNGKPDYYAVSVVPDSAFDRQGSLFVEQAVARGLAAAQAQGLISARRGNGALSARVQNFLALLRQGQPPEAAARQAGISMALVNKLSELGSAPEPQPEPTAAASPFPDSASFSISPVSLPPLTP